MRIIWEISVMDVSIAISVWRWCVKVVLIQVLIVSFQLFLCQTRLIDYSSLISFQVSILVAWSIWGNSYLVLP